MFGGAADYETRKGAVGGILRKDWGWEEKTDETHVVWEQNVLEEGICGAGTWRSRVGDRAKKNKVCIVVS